jgi:quercetin dioxygenase-like cupin family protein
MPGGEHNPPSEHDRDGEAVEYLLTPGEPGPRTHRSGRDRYAYVLEGQVAARIGAHTHVAGPGSVVAIPRGFDHALHSANQAAARVLVLEASDELPGDPGAGEDSLGSRDLLSQAARRSG